MAEEKRLKVILEATSAGLSDALKQATSAVQGSTAAWKTRLDEAQASIKVAEQSIKNLGETAKGLRDANVDIGGIPGMVDRINQAGSSLEGLRGDIERAVDGLSKLRAEGSSLGISFEDYQRLSEVLGEVGMSSEQFGETMRRMQSAVQGLSAGAPEAVDLFGRLGVTIEQLGSRSPIGQMELLASAVSGLSDPMHKAEAANRLFASSMEEVVKLGEAYRRSVELGGASSYATDADLNRLVQMQNQLNGLQGSLEGVQQQANQAGTMMSQSWGKSLDALDNLRASLYDLDQAYRQAAGMSADIPTASDQAWDSYLTKVSAGLDEMRQKIQQAVQDFNLLVDMNPGAGLMHIADVGSSESVDRLIQQISPLIEQLNEGDAAAQKFAQDFGNALVQMQSGAEGMQGMFDHMFDNLNNHLESVREKAQEGVALKVKTDLSELMKIQTRINQIRELFKNVKLNSELSSKIDELNRSFDRTYEVVERCNAAADRLVGFGERISGSFRNAGRAIVNYLHHPIQGLRDGILRCMDAINGFGNAADKAGQKGSAGAKQFIGMLLGVTSVVGGAVKAIKMVGNFINEYWIKPMKEAWKEMLRLSEMRLGMNKGLYSGEADRWKQAKQDLKEYYELLKKSRADDATSEDAERERQARRNLERKYAIEINPEAADVKGAVAGEMDTAQARYIKALEGKERELGKAQEEAQKALERVTSYWKSGIWYGGNWSAYEADVMSVQEKINALAKEYDEVRQQLHAARKETVGADFRRIEGAKSDDKAREARRKERERSGKAFEEKSKRRDEATAELDKWAAETIRTEGQRRLDEIYDKYDKMLAAGVPEKEARPILDAAIRKELERQAKEDADALEKETTEHRRHLEALKQANEREEDAKRRMLEAYRALYEARERRVYEERIEEIGKERERIRKQLDRFGFSLPKGWKEKPTAEDRRNAKLDKRIAEKIARQSEGRRVHFTRREQERIDEYKALQGKDKKLTAEEKQIRAAERQDAASKTMKQASDAFWEAVKAFYKAQTGKDYETAKEKRAREKREKRERQNRANAERRKAPGRSPKWSEGVNRGPNGGDGTGKAPKEQPKPSPNPSPRPAPKPAPKPSPKPAGESLPPVFLDFDEYLRRFTGDKSKAADYYRKYVEAFNRANGTKHEAETHAVPAEYPPTPIERTLPPEYDNATRDQRARALWNRRAHPEDYDDEGNWKYSPKAWSKKAAEAQEQADQWGRETGWMPGAMTQRDFEKVIAGLYAPPRYTDAGSLDGKDYSGLLERIAKAVEAKRNTYEVK